eukprot:Gb_36481 [translate_table: standard]
MLRKISNTELFSKRLEALQHLRRDKVFRTLHLIYNKVRIRRTMFLSSLNPLGNIIFSQNMFDPKSRSAEEFKETVWEFIDLLGTHPCLQFLDLQGIKRKGINCARRIYDLFDKCIENRLLATERNKSQNAKQDILDILLDLRGDGSSGTPKFTLADIKALLLDLFLGGSETTATTIEWAMAELIHNQAEFEEIVGCNKKVE